MLGEELREIWDGIRAVDEDLAQMFMEDIQSAYQATARRSSTQASQLSDIFESLLVQLDKVNHTAEAFDRVLGAMIRRGGRESMSCRCSDTRDYERDLCVLQRTLRDNRQLGQRIRTLAVSGHAGDRQDERTYPVEENLRAWMRQKTEEFSARALEAQQRYQRYLENCIWAVKDDLAAMQEEDDTCRENDDDQEAKNSRNIPAKCSGRSAG